MEGSTNNTNVANYEILAKYYDELLSNEEDLSLWIDYVKQKDCKDILELASGSGLLAKRLKQEGYNVIASDISKDMREIAKNNFDGEYLLLNMINYSLDRKFDFTELQSIQEGDLMKFEESNDDLSSKKEEAWHYIDSPF